MLVHLSQKIALDVTTEQEEYFFRACGTSRVAYNCGRDIWLALDTPRRKAKAYNDSQLAMKEWLAESGIKYNPKKVKVPRGPSVWDVSKAFTARKKADFPWMYEVTKYASKNAITDLGKAFQSFFRGNGFPKYKSRKNGDFSFCMGDSSEQLYNPENPKRIRVPGLPRFMARKLDVSSPTKNGDTHRASRSLGLVKMREALRFSGKIILATISLEAGRWFVGITVETELTPYDRGDTQTSVGVDLGAMILAYLSNGEQFEGPKPLRRLESRLKKLQKRFSKSKVITVKTEDGREYKRDSCMRAKLRLRIQKLHAHIARIRKDYLHKLTTYLAKTFDNIFIEDLNVQGMVKNHKLAKAILDTGFGEFKRQLVYKSKLYGSRVFAVDRWFPSSKKCSCCGEKQLAMPLSVRKWTCDNCGTHHDRDGNAASNLNGLLKYVLLADLAENHVSIRNTPTTRWDDKGCTSFEYNGRNYSLKNLTAA